MTAPHIFVSHSHDDSEIALAWAKLLRRVSMGKIEVWLSSDPRPSGGIPPGTPWAEVIYESLASATHVLAIMTPKSLDRRWIWWECGIARGVATERKVIPVAHSMKVEELPDPMKTYQGCSGDDREAVRSLCARLLDGTGLEASPQYWDPMLEEFENALKDPPRTGDVLIDRSHDQARWNWDHAPAPSILEVDTLKDRLAAVSTRPVSVKEIPSDGSITARTLRTASGLVFAMPLALRLGPQARDAIIDWVDGGGRLLLLGYELGDFHHGGNLNELAYRFGLHFESDIVAPPAWPGKRKPHGDVVAFPVAQDAHPVLSGLDTLSLVNVQTIRGEPGSRRLVGLGDNLLGRPVNPPEEVKYHDRKWQLVYGQSITYLPGDETHAVLVEAPDGLTGAGRVLALGTWKFARDASSERFLSNLFRWLSGEL